MDLCNRNDIQALLQRHGFHFSKAMGQNFLIEGWVPRDIAAASGADEHTGVLEIGPGIGPLTRELARRAGKVVSVELDRRLWPVLEETMAGCENFTLVQGDVMQQDLAALVGEHFGGLRPILCANLPYNITTPLLTRVVESRCFDSVTVLIQKEVAQRICAAPGTADYGAFSLLMQYYTAPELVFEVPNTCFLPAPKVTSAVIHCPARREPPVQVCSVADGAGGVRPAAQDPGEQSANRVPPAQGPAGGYRYRLRPAGKRPGRAAEPGGLCRPGQRPGGGDVTSA